MTLKFDPEWTSAPNSSGDPEDVTRCALSLMIGGHAMLRHEDLLNHHQVQDRIRVAAYPLTQWLTANWWRLRWEPLWTAAGTSVDDPEHNDWLMSHHLGAVAGGYYWPDLIFSSDGEAVLCQQRGTSGEKAPLRYLEETEIWLPAQDFEYGVEEFIKTTIEQLGDQAAEEHKLADSWAQLCEERADASIALLRRWEAMLGYDPEEAPEGLLHQLRTWSARAGETAIEEVAAAGRKQVASEVADIEQRLKNTGYQMTVPKVVMARASMHSTESPPWKRGYEAAAATRNAWGVEKDRLSNELLGECLDTPAAVLDGCDDDNTPVAVGRRQDSGRIGYYLGKRRPESRRFRLARIVADELYAGDGDHWLPCTDTQTSRQKFQRAFAQELLCPYDGLLDYLQTTAPDEDLCRSAAEYFQVSERMFDHILVNHDHPLPRGEGQSSSAYGYYHN